MAVVVLFSEFIKPAVNERWDAALLGADRRVLGIHTPVTFVVAAHQPSTSLCHPGA